MLSGSRIASLSNLNEFQSSALKHFTYAKTSYGLNPLIRGYIVDDVLNYSGSRCNLTTWSTPGSSST